MNPSDFSPESLMMSYGYKPELSEGSIKCPIFQTSTFQFKTAEEGKSFFEVAYGLREKEEAEDPGLIYSRLNNPNLEILEKRLCLWDKADDCAVFESGMAAISTALMEFTQPGDLLLYSNPLYGGTSHFIKHMLTKWGVNVMGFHPGESMDSVRARIKESGLENKLAMVYVETPANPTNFLIDMEEMVQFAKSYNTEEREVVVAVDNTYLGPIWQHPLEFGADLVLYSATKYIGGHSDVVAGACLGKQEHMNRIRVMRSFLGNMAGPNTGWLLMRSLETLKVRMNQQAANAERVADFLNTHPKVGKINFLGLLEAGTKQYEICKKQVKSNGAMLSFEIKGGEKEAFRFLNALKLAKLAVSLGSTESLVEHPATMTHAGIDPEEKLAHGITESLVRMSVGIEDADDLIQDIKQALEKV